MADLFRPIPGTETALRSPGTILAGASATHDIDLTQLYECELDVDCIPPTGDSVTFRLFRSVNGTAWSNIPTEIWVVVTADIPTVPVSQTSVKFPIHLFGPFHYQIHIQNDDGSNPTGDIGIQRRDAQRENITATYP